MTVQQDIQQMSADLRAFTNEMKKFANAQSVVTKETYVYSDAIEDAKDNLAKLERKIERQGKVSDELSRAQQRQLRAERDKIKLAEEFEKQKAALEDLRKAYRDNGKSMTHEEKENHKQQRKAGFDRLRDIQNNQKRNDVELSKVTGTISKAGTNIAGRINFVAGILTTLGNSFIEYSGRFMEATAASGGVIEEQTGNFDQGMSYWMTAMAATGVESQKALAIMSQNRQLVNSMGGMGETIRTVEGSVKDMLGFYGSQEEALKASTGILTQFANKGVAPTKRALDAYNVDLTRLAEQTGLSATAINGMIDSIANDVSSIDLLRSAREGERESILANQRALLKSNIALGMTAEQAAEASKMLNKMVAQKPLERLKQAAKMRALGAAMGLGPESEAAAQALSKSKGMRTNEDMVALNDFSVKMAGTIDQAAQAGLGSEIFASALLDKLDMNEYYGQGSAFSATLGDQLAKSQQDVSDMYKSSSDSTIVYLNYLANIASKVWGVLTDGTALWQMFIHGINKLVDWTTILVDFLQDALGKFIADFKDFGVYMHNIGEYIMHPIDESARDIKVADNADKYDVDYAKMVEVRETQRKAEKAERNKAEPVPTVVKDPTTGGLRAYSELNEKDRTVARPTTPGEKPTVHIAPNPTQDSIDKSRSDKAESILTDQSVLLTDQTNKIEYQLKQMVQSNEYLKVLAETNPKLLDVAEKQLAVSTMTQEQRNRAASRMSSENAKFSADYGYAV
ncbi:MAG: hypothetical protein CTY12_00185 [Methylotenera sp.]|nr:MAG: hypothetical protein CTY12_00185 [Methylotenera sp.]